MTLAIFDLDETLIAEDSCSLFCEYMVAEGHVDSRFVERDQAFMEGYKAGELDQEDYIAFFIGELSHLSIEEIDALLPDFVERYIRPVIYPHAMSLLADLKLKGLRPLIISATSAFIVKAVARSLEVDDFIAINLEQDAGFYTGKIRGVPSFREGKVTRLYEWLEAHEEALEGASFYSDSINDLPLLERVDFPVATNPDESLTEIATQRGWSILHWDLNDSDLNPNTTQHFTKTEHTHV